MARQVHEVKKLPGAYPDLPIAVGAADLQMLPADVTNKEEAVFAEGMMIVATNSDASNPHTLTVTSTPSGATRRSGDQVYQVTANNKPCVLGPFQANGWRQPDGKLYFEASDAQVAVAVIRG